MSDHVSPWLTPAGIAWPPPGAQLQPFGDYAPWGKRVCANLIDSAPRIVGLAIFAIGYVQFMVGLIRSSGTALNFSGGLSPMVVGGLVLLAGLGWTIYNRWFLEGSGGQSLGKRAMKIRLVSVATGGAVGPFNAFLRDLVHIVDGCALVGYLWPLWDDKKQTFADKLMNTVVVNAPAAHQPPSTAPAHHPHG